MLLEGFLLFFSLIPFEGKFSCIISVCIIICEAKEYNEVMVMIYVMLVTYFLFIVYVVALNHNIGAS